MSCTNDLWNYLTCVFHQTSKGPPPCDDKEGHYIIVPDDMIFKRCMPFSNLRLPFLIVIHPDRTVRLLGQGTFGKVVEAVDTHTSTRVAIKIIRAIPKYRDASKIEVRVLQRLKEKDPHNEKYVLFLSIVTLFDHLTSKCIHLLNWFDHRNHICLVSELFGMCVYDFLKENDFAPFPRQQIQSFARQLLGSVACTYQTLLVLFYF